MDTKEKKRIAGSVFDNPYFKNAYNALSDQDKEKYKKMGEYMYGNFNYTNNSFDSPPVEESVKYIECSLNSGLLPKDLSQDEKVFMKDTYGDKWYEKYGFTKKDCE